MRLGSQGHPPFTSDGLDCITLKSTTSNESHALLGLVATALLMRGAVWLIYGPAIFPDSYGYLALADQIRNADFSQYVGWRTPGYPLLLLVLGSDPRLVALVQAALGVLTSTLLF